MTRLIVVRHGQTEWNRVERFRGRADVPLNETGLKQAQAVARRIATTWKCEAVYYSDLARTRVTALTIAADCGARAIPQPGLLDIDYGSWTGLSPDEVAARDPGLWQLWREQPQEVQIPGGEMLNTVRQRAAACMEAAAARHEDGTVVLVSHIVVCRLLVLEALGLDTSDFWRIQQETGTINVFEWENGVYSIVAVNDACHLLSA
jgi:broad specificity phosphatase PhoE